MKSNFMYQVDHLFMHYIFFAMLLTSLSGCSLPMNQSLSDPPVTIDTQGWMNHHKDISDKLAQGLTGYLALDEAFISIASRIYLIRHAKYHVDLQYYIWKDDFIGHLMLSELLKAADRGVKIRLLIDDQNGTQLDNTLRALQQHPNVQIKIFNPYKFRNIRFFDYVLRPHHINHRMHNKLIVADGAIAVTGGRNISREYFEASEQFQFTDMDILFYGAAVKTANQVCQTFWDDALSYPVTQFIGQGKSQELEQLRQRYRGFEKNDDVIDQKINEAQQILLHYLKEQSLEWSKAYFVADSPKKITRQAQGNELIYQQMYKLMGKPQHHLELVSAYFVPTEKGTHYLSKMAQDDIKVRVLTNSFLANDVAVVHAFYQKYRQDLLQSGVELYEFKPYLYRSKPTWYEVATGHIIPAKGKNSSSLHAKFFDIDGKVFIGSFNFDPRSANLNTEVGLVVESVQLQKQISQALDQYLPQVAYTLKLDKDGNIIWLEQMQDGQVITHTTEPETSRFQRFMIRLVAKLPIEGLM